MAHVFLPPKPTDVDLKTFSLADGIGLQVPSSAQIINPAAFQRPQTTVARHNQASGAAVPRVGIGHNSSATDSPDPLLRMTPKQIFFECIWLSKESTAAKLMLVCIWRFFDSKARSSSMSYAQIASDCTLHESSAKRIAKDILGKWLTVGVQKGFKTASGKQNLYHGICPSDLVEELRELKRKGRAVEPDEAILAAADATVKGVASGDPFNDQGVASGGPSSQGVASCDARGRITGGVTLHNSEQEEDRGADTSADATLPLDDEPAQQAGNEPGKKSPKKRAAPRDTGDRGTRWPKGQVVPEDWRAWAAREFRVTPVDIRREADSFADYWPGRGDSGAIRTYWEGAWRNWCRKTFKGKEANRAGAQPDTDVDHGADLDAAYEQIRRDREGSQ